MHLSNPKRFGKRGFSLIELIVVVVIIGLIAAIAIPKVSRGVVGATDATLAQDLAQMRQALDMFQNEHGGVYPTMGMINSALTTYTDDTGTSGQTTKDSTHPWGPYLKAIPPLPVGPAKGGTLIGQDSGPTLGTNVGWLYNPATGAIRANCSNEIDSAGNLYSSY